MMVGVTPGRGRAARRRSRGRGEKGLELNQPVLQSDVAVPPALESAVRSYLGHLAVERGLAANTLSSYRRDLRRYMAALAGRGRTAIDQVGEDDVRSFLAALREGD
ncbi:MAG TPA: site-specific integrase, partial [Streptosporangiaceae bacterium]|nr:site-specific integrase [Streptosporangiaceae bacterium]